jgi:hypothetical protein
VNKYVPPVSGVLNCTAAGVTSFGCETSCPWDPAVRDNTPPDLDDIGVMVEFEHDPIVGFFPFNNTFAVSDRAVMRIEPNTRG